MREMIVVLAAFCIWIVTFSRFRIWKQIREKSLKSYLRLKLAYYSNLFLACAITLFYNPVGTTLNTQVGMKNFSWLTAYLFAIAGFYTYNLYAYNLLHLPINVKLKKLNLQKKIWLTSSVALSLIYWFTIRLSPEWPSRLPNPMAEVIFQDLFFGVLIIQCLSVAWITVMFIKQEGNKFFKLQACLSLIAIMIGITCFILKIVFVSLWLYSPSSPRLILLNQLALLAMALTGLLSLSNSIVIPIITPFWSLVKAFLRLPAWFDLLNLQKKLYQHQLIVAPEEFSLLQYLAEPNYHMLKIIISVLDIQKSQEKLEPSSDKSKRKLLRAINNLNPDLEYKELIAACRKINQLLP